MEKIAVHWLPTPEAMGTQGGVVFRHFLTNQSRKRDFLFISVKKGQDFNARGAVRGGWPRGAGEDGWNAEAGMNDGQSRSDPAVERLAGEIADLFASWP